MDRICVIEGCVKQTRTGKADLCKMHYHRQYRHGDVSVVGSVIHTRTAGSYKRLYLPGHPLADAIGLVYTHRAVLYDVVGPGPHPCHWCGTAVDWQAAGSGYLQADHVNGDREDNRPENLVPSCGPCNSRRASRRRVERLRERGLWARHDTVAALRNGRLTL